MKRLILITIFIVILSGLFSESHQSKFIPKEINKVEFSYDDKLKQSEIIINVKKLGRIVEELREASISNPQIIKISMNPSSEYKSQFIKISSSINEKDSLRSVSVTLYDGNNEVRYIFPAGTSKIDNNGKPIFYTAEYLLYRTLNSIAFDYAEKYLIMNLLTISEEKLTNMYHSQFKTLIKDNILYLEYENNTFKFDLNTLNDPYYYLNRIKNEEVLKEKIELFNQSVPINVEEMSNIVSEENKETKKSELNLETEF